MEEVEGHRDKSLGVGSYGSVCKARIGELTCAANHSSLFCFTLVTPILKMTLFALGKNASFFVTSTIPM